ncbi:MAG: hypothetical protein QXX94_07790 [Candidatus Bathyarchaeia archaeon]
MRKPDLIDEKEGISALNFRVILAIIFASVVMMPVAVWMNLIGGVAAGIGFTTILLFSYIARSYGQPLTKQEIQLMNGAISIAAYTVFFMTFVQNTYLANSPEARAFGITEYIPAWLVPNNPYIRQQFIRTFLTPEWFLPISLALLTNVVLYNIIHLSLGYLVYQLYVVEEKLPFPFARAEAEMAVTIGEREPAKVRVMLLGFLVSFFYSLIAYGLPLIGSSLGFSWSIIPIPFVDLTYRTEVLLPGALIGFATDMFSLFSGFIIPFISIIWMLIGSTTVWIAGNVIAIKYFRETLFPKWRPGLSLSLSWQLSFLHIWASAIIGASLAVALIQIVSLRRSIVNALKSLSKLDKLARKGGIMPLWAILTMYFGGTIVWLMILLWLLPGFPIAPLIFLVIVWPFFITLINARAIGEVGYSISGIPLKEMLYTISLQSYGVPVYSDLGVGVWFAPLPVGGLYPSGETWAFQFYAARYVGLRIGDVVKTILLISVPFSFLMSFIYVSTIWSFGPIPSHVYPYAQITWPLNVITSCLWITRSGSVFRSILIDSSAPPIVEGAFIACIILHLITKILRIPFSLVSFVTGMSMIPPYTMAITTGWIIYSMLCRKYGKKLIDQYKWAFYTGIFIGYGVINAISISVTIVIKSIWIAPY